MLPIFKGFQDLFVPIIVLGLWTLYSIIYIYFYYRNQIDPKRIHSRLFNNEYIFESLPPVFPTLGILCTAYGITIGIWHFDAEHIQQSIPKLLNGLRLAFIATMGGIVGLIVFQKVTSIVQKRIDRNPNRPKRNTDELSALAELSFAVDELRKGNEKQFEKLADSFNNQLENKIASKLLEIKAEILSGNKANSEVSEKTHIILEKVNSGIEANKTHTVNEIVKLREEQSRTSEKANRNTDEIIRAMTENNNKTAAKFNEFSLLLSKNNTEALVTVMKNATEQFNSQMSELINRLVQENFKELNTSVKNLNDWQKENKEQIERLTTQFQKTTELFNISSVTLKEVATNTKLLTDTDSKLSQIVQELKRVMIEDGKFQKMATDISGTVETLKQTTEAFDQTTHKLNDWVKTEKKFKEAAEIIILKLEEFRNLNGDVWNKYRKEMSDAVSIIKDTSKRLGEDLDNINGEFYNRLSDTLTNLDECIQRFVPVHRK